jgi:hypothetical protein
VELATQSCPPGDFFIADGTTNKDIMIRILLSAIISGRSVSLNYANTTGCDITAVTIY